MTGANTTAPSLVYVGDPMCSWCYGFGLELSTALAQRPEVRLEIVTGGLRAGGTEVLDDAGKRFRLFHWAKVEAATGLSFNREALMARQGFVYDTEPACRAVVAARIAAPAADLLTVFRAIQNAFYVDGLDTTAKEVLVRVVTQSLRAQAFSAEGLEALFEAQSTRQAAHEDFAQARRWGISSFPALLVRQSGFVTRLVDGFAKAPVLVAAMDRWADQMRAGPGT
ncbi:DsbA family protein [Acidovorax sp. Q11]